VNLHFVVALNISSFSGRVGSRRFLLSGARSRRYLESGRGRVLAVPLVAGERRGSYSRASLPAYSCLPLRVSTERPPVAAKRAANRETP
jgi:hypothetical protein